LNTHKSSWPFIKPVSREDVHDYYEVIKDPIDLESILERIGTGYYTDVKLFEKDVIRMFTNCKEYNDKDTIYWLLANSLQEYITPYLKKMKDKFGTSAAE
jgi:histone acetyltransferase